jgi:hypothetical protein
VADRGRRRADRINQAGGDGAGALFQHAGPAQVPAHRRHRIRSLRRDDTAAGAGPSAGRVRRAPQRPRPAQCAGPVAVGARGRDAGRCIHRHRGDGVRRGGHPAPARLGRASGVCGKPDRTRRARRAICVRQRPLCPRPRDHPCVARRVSRCAASRCPAVVRVVAERRSPRRRCQCASDQDRGPLSRQRRRARIRPACAGQGLVLYCAATGARVGGNPAGRAVVVCAAVLQSRINAARRALATRSNRNVAT